MQAIKRVDINGEFIGDVLGVEQEENSVLAVLENGELIGYNITVPLPVGFKAYVSSTNSFRFDLEAWAGGGQNTNLSIFWIEGLTPEEIAELTKPGELSETEQLRADNAALLLELVQTQARQDQAEQDQAALLLSLVEGGVL